MKRIFAVVLASLMLMLTFASCGGGAEKISVTLKVNAGGEDGVILDVPVELSADKCTVLDAFIEGCDNFDYTFDNNDDPKSIVDIDKYTDHKDEAGIAYFWTYTVNGEEPESGTAADNTVKAGDVIEYIYTSFDPNDK